MPCIGILFVRCFLSNPDIIRLQSFAQYFVLLQSLQKFITINLHQYFSSDKKCYSPLLILVLSTPLFLLNHLLKLTIGECSEKLMDISVTSVTASQNLSKIFPVDLNTLRSHLCCYLFICYEPSFFGDRELMYLHSNLERLEYFLCFREKTQVCYQWIPYSKLWCYSTDDLEQRLKTVTNSFLPRPSKCLSTENVESWLD